MNKDFRQTAPNVTVVDETTYPTPAIITPPRCNKIHLFKATDANYIYLNVILPGGIAESESQALATLSSIMMREGTSFYTSKQISEELDYCGAWLRQTTCAHHRTIGIYALSSNIDRWLPVFSDIVNHPEFDEKALTVRRESLAKNIEVSMTNTSFLASCRCEQLIMGERHPLAIVDTPEQIRAISRSQISDFHRRYTQCGDRTIVACGNISEKDLAKIAEAVSPGVAPVNSNASLRYCPFREQPSVDPYIMIERDDAEQSSVAIAIPAPMRHEADYLPLHMAVYALGGYFGSRLMTNIRQQQALTYGINASLLGYADGSFVAINADTSHQNVGLLLESVEREIKSLITNPPSGDELNRIRQSAMSAHTAILNTPISTADFFSQSITSSYTPEYFNLKSEAISHISSTAIAEMAEKYLKPEFMRTVVAGKIC